MRTSILLAVFCFAAVAAPVPKESKRGDTFEGTWQFVSAQQYNNPLFTDDKRHDFIDADGYVRKSIEGPALPENTAVEFRYLIDSKNNTVDLEFAGTGILLGIYKLHGESLEVCYNPKGGARPTKIEQGPDVFLYTFKRVAPRK